MALANIACLLSQDERDPQRVLVWDFDLEAPGLHRIFPPEQPHKLGFVDLAHQFARTGKLPEIRDFIYKSPVGGIDVLPAGAVDQAYCAKLQELHWPGFLSSDVSDLGPLFGPARNAINAIEPNYDYILIDSRTGLNDQAGICTQLLPDLVVVLFRLTAQNQDGLQHVVPMTRHQLRARKKGHVRLLPVATFVSPTTSKETLANKTRAQQLFEAKELNYIRFDADLINEERLFCLKENRDEIWPLPPIVDDYKRICARIRGTNENDTRTQSSRIRELMARGDPASAARVLMPTMKRRPRNSELWRTLDQLFQNRQVLPNDADGLVEEILQGDPRNYFCFEWKAWSLLRNADSPESETLVQAGKFLEKAIEYSDDVSDAARLLRTLARVNSCQGTLEMAVQFLRKIEHKAARNVQLSLEIAMLYMRMGAKYFSSAIDSVQTILDSTEEKQLWLAYLFAFLEEREKAERSFQEFSELAENRLWIDLCRAHYCLITGDRLTAIEIADAQLREASHPGVLDNVAELFICAEEFDRAVECFARPQKKSGRQQKRKADDPIPMVELARYLRGVDDCTQDKVINAWQRVDNWGFKELILFRERVWKGKKSELAKRLEILEPLIRNQESARFRAGPGIWYYGPSGVGPVRSVREIAIRFRDKLASHSKRGDG
jgi:MinD-like ATPase involved in chromosome partitioning or flagellar assembly